ncbi:hypothetical protein H0H92_010904, partial [Tricholoma furcatifolium]
GRFVTYGADLFQVEKPTEEITKQYFKNKRKNAYRNGWMGVPDKYSHLKDTSAKRNPAGSRIKRVKTARAAAARERRREQRMQVHAEDNSDVDMND